MNWSGLPERLESKIQPEPNSGCWLWIASCDTTGYGHVRWEGRLQQSHRVIYEYKHGKIVPEALVLDHFRCEMRCCVNPEHVKPVTEQQNILRGVTTKAHQYAKRTHCKNGHLLNATNIYHPPGSAARVCKICRGIGSRKSVAKKPEKYKAYHRKWMSEYRKRKSKT